MKVADYLAREQLSADDLAAELGLKNASAIKGLVNKDGDMYPSWLERLASGSAAIPLREAAATTDGAGSGDGMTSDERRAQQPPRPPAGARVARVETLDYSAIGGYIEGAYKLAAQTVSSSDPILGEVIREHAEPAGQAWAKWIESEPKVAAVLAKLMVGTPAGEVIYVHVSIVFAYTLARGASRTLAREAAERAAAAADDGRADTDGEPPRAGASPSAAAHPLAGP